MTNKKIRCQEDLNPTEAERQNIIDDLVKKNAERVERGLPERDVTQFAELAFKRHRSRDYQALLAPYLEAALDQVRAQKVGGLSPLDYRNTTAAAQKALHAATGIMAPESKLTPKILDLIGHTPIKAAEADGAAVFGNGNNH